MKLKIDKIHKNEYADAIASLDQYEFALLGQFDGYKVLKTEEILPEYWEKCAEARLFSKDRELHLFPQEQTAYLAVEETTDEKETVFIDRKYKFDSNRPEKWNTIVVRQYLQADEDGQNSIFFTRLVTLE